MTEGDYPKAESARSFRPEENEKFVKLFNEQKFRPRTAILKVWFKYPTNMFFQPIPAQDKITFTNRIDGFYKPEIYYTDTDSLYISSSNWDKLNEAGLVSENENSKGKNDYGDGGIIFGLYLAPKVKYNIILTSDGILKEKKTFKGYSNYKIKVEDYIQLASGHDVTNEFDKPWVKSFTDGIVIPNEKQKKVFRSYLNLVKRKAPNSEGIMYPYTTEKN
ncbi:hypothetical protein LOTGIDRAFT_152455 [Lottia gigantea]|uniref:DNA-directed DNA polymerase n=1 Tax=Lottia gigantea TaxID=225164 RepID=V4B532_LOTGI|nr:hypothetical protein LOTGIDRAFT_152455 [Lottia gigantea]ESP05598.1 hypothetical protein LOTGIDRAFT_152455 [Lottia gigantea]